MKSEEKLTLQLNQVTNKAPDRSRQTQSKPDSFRDSKPQLWDPV